MAMRETSPREITVQVTLFADLRRFWGKGEEGPKPIVLPEGATAEQMLDAMNIPQDEAVRSEITVGLNGELGKRDSVLSDGDDIVLFSPMEGG